MVSQLSSGKKGDRASKLEIAIELNNLVTLVYKNNEKNKDDCDRGGDGYFQTETYF